jgi:beta-glucanase (GH16 family)
MTAVKIWILVLFLLLGSPDLRAEPPTGPGYSWKLIFEDDFTGTSLDTSKWISQLPWTRDFKGDAYMRDQNVTVSNGILTITAKAEDYAGHEFTSGGISTGYSKFRFEYGYAEARINMPSARGSWCNFWMLADGWPPEIDICEYPLDDVEGDGNQRYRYISNIHYGDSQSNMGTHWKGDLSAGYHIYALDWRPWYVAYYFDNSYVRSLNDFQPSNDFGPMYLILDYYVGGDWSGQVWQHPDPDTWPNPAISDAGKMQIEWVRVWQRYQDTNLECTGYWTLDETTGTLATDSSGHSNHGILLNGLSFANDSIPGVRGTALEFDGVDDYISLADGFGELDNGFSVCFWAKPTATKRWARFIDFGNGADDNNIYLARRSTTNDLIFGVYENNSGHFLTAPDAIENNQWHFYAAVVTSSGNAALYKDGLRIRFGSLAWPWGVIRTRNYIGRSNWSADEYYQGALDDIRTYDYTLDQYEIADLYGLPIVTVENYSFELPGTDKQNNWQNVPGWNSDTVAADSGVEFGWAPTEGSWSGFLMGSDPSVWQLTDHVILPGAEYRLKIDAENNSDATQLQMSLYYDNDGDWVTAVSRIVDLADENGSGQKQEFTLFFSSYDLPSAVGHRLGIEIDNPADGWAGFDNVHISYEVHQTHIADLNYDGRIDNKDYCKLAQYWRRHESPADIAPQPVSDGKVDFKDLALFVEYWLKATTIPPLPAQASSPYPTNHATGIAPDANLSWTAGASAVSHNVYIGTSNPPPFISNVSVTTFVPGWLPYQTIIYWRIDEINSWGRTTGQIWEFTTESSPPPMPGQASNPNPADGATGVSIDQDLRWTSGSGVTSHDVYFGTSMLLPFIKNQTAATFNPGGMELGTKYYWRINEKNAFDTIVGPLWSFTTTTTPPPPP